jgi:hypothetical protein
LTRRHYYNLHDRHNRKAAGLPPPGLRRSQAAAQTSLPWRGNRAGAHRAAYAAVETTARRAVVGRARAQRRDYAGKQAAGEPTFTAASGPSGSAGIIDVPWRRAADYLEVRMKGNLVIICRDQDAQAFDYLMAEYGAYQIRLSSTAWYLKLETAPERVQEEILSRLGKYTTHYIFEADSVIYNTVDSEAASALDALFAE